jgi:phage terminase large subunit GpA-like protein
VHRVRRARSEGPEHLKTFVNTVLGEPWKDRGDAPEWQRLYARRETYAIGSCPAGVLFLTAGVDVQKDRLVYEVVGWGRDKAVLVDRRGVLPGDTSDLTRRARGRARGAARATFPHEAAPICRSR